MHNYVQQIPHKMLFVADFNFGKMLLVFYVVGNYISQENVCNDHSPPLFPFWGWDNRRRDSSRTRIQETMSANTIFFFFKFNFVSCTTWVLDAINFLSFSTTSNIKGQNWLWKKQKIHLNYFSSGFSFSTMVFFLFTKNCLQINNIVTYFFYLVKFYVFICISFLTTVVIRLLI